MALFPLARIKRAALVEREAVHGLEVARVLATDERPFTTELLFFDGELLLLDERLLDELGRQVALHFGANDLDGTIFDERITHAAGGTAGTGMPNSVPVAR